MNALIGEPWVTNPAISTGSQSTRAKKSRMRALTGNYDENQPATWATGDMNYDGIFTPDDAAIFGGAYDESLASLPEPSAAVLSLGLMALGLGKRSRKARA